MHTLVLYRNALRVLRCDVKVCHNVLLGRADNRFSHSGRFFFGGRNGSSLMVVWFKQLYAKY